MMLFSGDLVAIKKNRHRAWVSPATPQLKLSEQPEKIYLVIVDMRTKPYENSFKDLFVFDGTEMKVLRFRSTQFKIIRGFDEP